MTLFEKLRVRILAVLKVPHEPEPPLGAPESIRVFRAGRNFYKLRLLGWGVGQALALLGIIFWVVVVALAERESRVTRESAAAARPAAIPQVQEVTDLPPPIATNGTEAATNSTTKTKKKVRPRNDPIKDFVTMTSKMPPWTFTLLWTLKIIFFFVYLGQAAVTYAILRLDYEQRWYIVTDRSLRIRSGLWSVQEMTMSFANLQQVALSQGPLQRFLGISDVRVQSAGGGGGGTHGQKGQDASLHTGVFHGVENAKEIRDLILERLRLFRETGLGDPDEAIPATQPHPTAATTDSVEASTLVAARELITEARALRHAADSLGHG